MSDMSEVWWAKYRPQTLKDLKMSEENRLMIESFEGEIPNLLLCGSPGSGKTTLARILVLNVLKCDYLYINASDENGIDTVRSKINGFVQTKSFDGQIKVVILDEVDRFTTNAQDALRNVMESYIDNARFILTGNHKHKITSALQSRCRPISLRFTLKQAVERCLEILKIEGIKTDNVQKTELIKMIKSFYPDLRKCIDEMQRFVIDGELKIAQIANNNQICAKICTHLSDGTTLNLRSYLIKNDEIFNSDWDQLLVDLLNYIYTLDEDDSKKKAMILTIADHLEKASRVNDKEINFFACVLNLEQL